MDGSLSASFPPLAVLSPRGSSVTKRRHCTFLPHFPELDRVPGACCMCHTNLSIFKAFPWLHVQKKRVYGSQMLMFLVLVSSLANLTRLHQQACACGSRCSHCNHRVALLPEDIETLPVTRTPTLHATPPRTEPHVPPSTSTVNPVRQRQTLCLYSGYCIGDGKLSARG